jgi:hypothetical protein
MQILQEEMNNLINNSIEGGGTTLEIHKLTQDGSLSRGLTNTWEDDDYGDGDSSGETFKQDGETQLYLLGFLEKKVNDSELPSSGVTKANKLFAIPNIGVDSNGITIKGGIEVDKITINQVLSLTDEAKGYAPSGIYNREPLTEKGDTSPFEGIEEMKFYEE